MVSRSDVLVITKFFLFFPIYLMWNESSSIKNCELRIRSNGTLKVDSQQFGSSLRAASYTSAGKDVIFVPRYYEDRFT